MKRVFVYDNRQFPDFDPSLTVDQIRQRMADHFPELANATYQETKTDEATVYTFQRRTGTKGGPTGELDIPAFLQILDALPESTPLLVTIAEACCDDNGLIDMNRLRAHPLIDDATAQADRQVRTLTRINQSLQALT